jgi:GTP cyclohydrolase II
MNAIAHQTRAVFIRREVPIPLLIQETEHVARFVTFEGLADAGEHVALIFGEPDRAGTVMVRVHSECLTGDVFGSCRCDCGPQLREAMSMLSETGGVLLYMRHEGRGIGLYNKLDAYALQDRGHDTFEANRALGFADDLRDFSVAAHMLAALGVRRVCLITNNPDKVLQLQHHGVRVESTSRRPAHTNPHNVAYLHTKRVKARHALSLNVSEEPAEANDQVPLSQDLPTDVNQSTRRESR